MNRDTYSEEEIEALITGTERGLIRFAMRYLKDHAVRCRAGCLYQVCEVPAGTSAGRGGESRRMAVPDDTEYLS